LLAHHPVAQKAAWSRATVSFAIFQAGSAYGLSYIFARTDNYRLLFVIEAAAMTLAFFINLTFGEWSK
jgi:molybdate-binding protein